MTSESRAGGRPEPHAFETGPFIGGAHRSGSSGAARLQALREQMPAVEANVYLNTGTSGPLPRPVREAIAAAVEAEFLEGRIHKEYGLRMAALRRRVRHKIAAFIGADPSEIALLDNTTDGINSFVMGIPWRPGDQVITTEVEHMSALVPLYLLRERFGVEIRFVDGGIDGRGLPEAVAAALGPRTRLVVLSHVSFSSGALLPVRRVTDIAHEGGAWVLVDGAQSVGAIPVDVHELDVDGYALPGQKWLLGPQGTGALYVASRCFPALQMSRGGYLSVRDHDGQGYYLPKEGAERFETGLTFLPAWAGLEAALDFWRDEVGEAWAYGRIREGARFLRERLAELDTVEVVTAGEGAGLVSFRLKGEAAAVAPEEAVKVLAGRGYLIRSIPGTGFLRASVGFFNTTEELAGLAEALKHFKKG